MTGIMTYDEMVRNSVSMGVPKDKAEAAAALVIAQRTEKPPAPAKNLEGPATVNVTSNGFDVPAARIHRERDTVTGVFELAPRTKKNHKRSLFADSYAYKRYEDGIVAATRSARADLCLPLPRQPYNLAAVFYVDSPGKRADITGLLQGICDALQEAKIIVDDWDIRTVDGCRVVTDDPKPRVEFILSPIEDA